MGLVPRISDSCEKRHCRCDMVNLMEEKNNEIGKATKSCMK